MPNSDLIRTISKNISLLNRFVDEVYQSSVQGLTLEEAKAIDGLRIAEDLLDEAETTPVSPQHLARTMKRKSRALDKVNKVFSQRTNDFYEILIGQVVHDADLDLETNHEAFEPLESATIGRREMTCVALSTFCSKATEMCDAMEELYQRVNLDQQMSAWAGGLSSDESSYSRLEVLTFLWTEASGINRHPDLVRMRGFVQELQDVLYEEAKLLGFNPLGNRLGESDDLSVDFESRIASAHGEGRRLCVVKHSTVRDATDPVTILVIDGLDRRDEPTVTGRVAIAWGDEGYLTGDEQRIGFADLARADCDNTEESVVCEYSNSEYLLATVVDGKVFIPQLVAAKHVFVAMASELPRDSDLVEPGASPLDPAVPESQDVVHIVAKAKLADVKREMRKSEINPIGPKAGAMVHDTYVEMVWTGNLQNLLSQGL